MPNIKKATSIDIQIAENIKTARKAKNISQTDIGNRLGISYQQYQKIESGRNRLTVGRLVEIAELLQIPPQVLLANATPLVFNY